jgi:hypothetical protein
LHLRRSVLLFSYSYQPANRKLSIHAFLVTHAVDQCDPRLLETKTIAGRSIMSQEPLLSFENHLNGSNNSLDSGPAQA